MEDAGRSDGWTDHQRCAGDASSQRLQSGLQTRFVEGNLCVRQCLCAPGDQIITAQREDGEWYAQTSAVCGVLIVQNDNQIGNPSYVLG